LKETKKVKRVLHFLSARSAALRPGKAKSRACREQLRASLRRKELFFSNA
jgi:hypothetical protein